MKKYKVLWLITVISSFASGVHAAPFCVSQQGLNPECIYTDAIECRKRAAQMNGLCYANPAELNLQPGIGKYCVVYSDHTSSCIYTDRTSCDNDAVRNGGLCVEAPNSNVQQDPYSKDRNTTY